MHRTVVLGLAVLLCVSAGPAADWPQFGGPEGNFTSPETGLARSWPEGGPKVLWSAKAGKGFGGPAIRDGQVHLLERVGKQDVLRCFDLLTGKELFKNAKCNPQIATPLLHKGHLYINSNDNRARDGRLVVRDHTQIKCLDVRATE